MSRNTPATTIVDLCSRAETGVGPSIAAGSHGCNPNWADFPIAASKQENKITSFHPEDVRIKKPFNFHELFLNRAMLMKRIIPMSPTRLYIIA